MAIGSTPWTQDWLDPREPATGRRHNSSSYAGAAGEAVLKRQRSTLKNKNRKLVSLTSVFCGLTPELSRAAERPRQWPNHSCHGPRPRSGLGLNELLDRCQPELLPDHFLFDLSSEPKNRSLRTSQTQKRSAGALAGTEFVARIKHLDEATKEQVPTWSHAC